MPARKPVDRNILSPQRQSQGPLPLASLVVLAARLWWYGAAVDRQKKCRGLEHVHRDGNNRRHEFFLRRLVRVCTFRKIFDGLVCLFCAFHQWILLIRSQQRGILSKRSQLRSSNGSKILRLFLWPYKHHPQRPPLL